VPVGDGLLPGSDEEIAAGLAAIVARLSSLVEAPASLAMGTELAAIRADLKRLAGDNEQVGRLLGERLGIQIPPDAPKQ
jgi:hypothetical protein